MFVAVRTRWDALHGRERDFGMWPFTREARVSVRETFVALGGEVVELPVLSGPIESLLTDEDFEITNEDQSG